MLDPEENRISAVSYYSSFFVIFSCPACNSINLEISRLMQIIINMFLKRFFPAFLFLRGFNLLAHR